MADFSYYFKNKNKNKVFLYPQVSKNVMINELQDLQMFLINWKIAVGKKWPPNHFNKMKWKIPFWELLFSFEFILELTIRSQWKESIWNSVARSLRVLQNCNRILTPFFCRNWVPRDACEPPSFNQLQQYILYCCAILVTL